MLLNNKNRRPLTVALHMFVWVGLFLSLIFLTLPKSMAAQPESKTTKTAATPNTLSPSNVLTHHVYLPATYGQPIVDPPLCRFGVNALEDPNLTNLPDLRAGWYMNFRADANPPRPDGMEYMPVIRFQPDNSPEGYSYMPDGAELLNVIAANPGAKWLIGNEPDSPFQDNLVPEVYARAYHELYHLIKDADPTAQIIAGSIVQATEIRLLYLDMILNSYQTQFGEPFPAEGWSIHNYILNEVSCDYDPSYCWGADIPPGVDRDYGEIWGIKDNDRVDIFIERIMRFRQWLADRGYTGQPVYLTEYGVLMPADLIDENGENFPPSRVNTFMAGTYDYMLTATDPDLGDPNDGYRLVQQWAWFSTTGTNYNGALFNPNTYQPTAMGAFFADYTADIGNQVDFYPHQIGVAPPIPSSQGEPVTVTLRAAIANSGNLAMPITATVHFYDAHPQSGGEQIGTDQVVSLAGCGDHQEATVAWANVSPGAYDVYVHVEAPPLNGVSETSLANNLQTGQIQIGSQSATSLSGE